MMTDITSIQIQYKTHKQDKSLKAVTKFAEKDFLKKRKLKIMRKNAYKDSWRTGCHFATTFIFTLPVPSL